MRDHLIDVVGIGTLGFWAVCFGVYNGNLTQGSSGTMLVVGNERVSCVRRGSRAWSSRLTRSPGVVRGADVPREAYRHIDYLYHVRPRAPTARWNCLCSAPLCSAPKRSI